MSEAQIENSQSHDQSSPLNIEIGVTAPTPRLLEELRSTRYRGLGARDFSGALDVAKQVYAEVRTERGPIDVETILALSDLCRIAGHAKSKLTDQPEILTDITNLERRFLQLDSDVRLQFACSLIEYQVHTAVEPKDYHRGFSLFLKAREDLLYVGEPRQPTREFAQISLQLSSVELWRNHEAQQRSLDYVQKMLLEMHAQTRPAEANYVYGLVRAAVGDVAGSAAAFEKASNQAMTDTSRRAAHPDLEEKALEGLGLVALQQRNRAAAGGYFAAALKISNSEGRPLPRAEFAKGWVTDPSDPSTLAIDLINRALRSRELTGPSRKAAERELLHPHLDTTERSADSSDDSLQQLNPPRKPR